MNFVSGNVADPCFAELQMTRKQDFRRIAERHELQCLPAEFIISLNDIAKKIKVILRVNNTVIPQVVVILHLNRMEFFREKLDRKHRKNRNKGRICRIQSFACIGEK